MSTQIMTLAQINESSVDTQANIYADKYQEQVDVYESFSVKSKIGESLSPYEVVALGQQLDQFSNYVKFCESQGNLGSLGNIPQVALDVITASVGASILPLLASIQPIAEEHGIVYYKQMKAMQTGGGYTAGDVISSPLSRDNPGDGTIGGNRRSSNAATTAAGTVTYSGNISTVPLRPFRIDVNVVDGSTLSAYGRDDGQGKILGIGFSGTINYATGAWSITFAADPGTGKVVQLVFDIDTDGQASLDQVQSGLATKDIRAQIWALRSDVGAFANFAFSQRFGRSAVDEVAQDLTNELTRVMNTAALKAILGNLPAASSTWNRTPDSGVSYAEHKLTFIDGLATAESVLHNQSGASGANRYLVGKTAAALLRGMPDFQVAPDAAAVSVGLYGYYDGVPVIRGTGIVGDNDIILLSNTGNYFNAPLAYAPFMPLMVTNTVQSPTNPFRNTVAAGTWAGLTSLNGNLSTKLTITS